MIFFKISSASSSPVIRTPIRSPSAVCFVTVPFTLWGDRCGGNFRYTENGIKDCTLCLRPHIRENYLKILEKMPEIMELAKKKTAP